MTISKEQVDRIEATLAKLIGMMEQKAWMLPTQRSVPVGEPTYTIPASQTFAAEIHEAREARNDSDEQLQRSLAARHHATPSQADVWTVLIQFFPQIKAYVNARVQDFEGAALRAFEQVMRENEDD